MECLGISENDGTIYEGRLGVGFRTSIQPLLVPIKFPAFELTTWTSTESQPSTIFREDFFDPITRIRRGRVFTLREFKNDWLVHDPLKPHSHTNNNHHQEKVALYQRACMGQLKVAPLKAEDRVAIIGHEPFVSFWKIITIESSVPGTPILTLKSYRSLGDLPEIDNRRVPKPIKSKLEELMEGVANSNHRAGAIDVVDRSRAALSLILGHLAGDRTADLGKSITTIRGSAKPLPLVCSTADIVARLHSRGKPNEEYKHGTRPVSEEDAQLAIGCLGLVLKEVGWTKS